MQDVLNTLKRMQALESVQVNALSGQRLSVLVKSWRCTTNGEIDECMLRTEIEDALGDKTYQVETYQDGEEWANVLITRRSK